MVDWENLPFKSFNQLRYNPELFRAQSKCLMYGNLVFGIVASVVVILGFLVLNQTEEEKLRDGTHIQCFDGDEWLFQTAVGNIFGMLH